MSDTPGRRGRRWLLGVALGTLFATPAMAEVTRPRPPRRVRRVGSAQTPTPAQRPTTPPAATRPGTRGGVGSGGDTPGS
ncbi:hypothetical protein J5Y09_14480 [Roseomonas sp. PWR1]|uniref:Uncharacterized protein n=1 Tax=Roseomonas nitratireducens TaxID=2820810 RepID=A0ABS4AUT6_9PROT|nr:hypothetical protein [Neoroseomonas nitratireducens]MBP0465128.1 hypothetical protein [Neoroseomonas nitratireducens]